METSTTLAELAKALAKFQFEVESVTKDAVNPFYKSKYATLENIAEKIKKPMNDNGLSYVQLPTGDNGLTTMLMHTSGEWVRSTMTLHPAKNDPQGQGSAITYARRYALSALLGLVTDEDDDGNEASTPKKPAETLKTAPKAPAKPKSTETPYQGAKRAIEACVTQEQVAETEKRISASTKLTDEEIAELLTTLDARAQIIP